jgi:hypothetical protein
MAIAWTAREAINTQQKNTIAVIKPAFRKASWAGIVSTSAVIPSGHFSPTLSSNRFGVCCGLGERPFGEDSRYSVSLMDLCVGRFFSFQAAQTFGEMPLHLYVR